MIILLFFYVILNVVALMIMVPASIQGNGNFSFVNPIVIYEHVRVNWFGAILICILLNLLLPAISIPYWIYKLVTVGRSKDDKIKDWSF